MPQPQAAVAAPAPGERTQIMGVLNVTPDSFSDGGRWYNHADAVDHGFSLLAGGADIIDVGGESTRPGAARVSEEEELGRVVPVVRELARDGAVISVDTMRETVARAALDAGAAIVNDVSAGQSEPGMLALAAEAGVPIILMHWRGHLGDTSVKPHYADTVAEVAGELEDRVRAALAQGVSREQIVLDPGLGFSKNARHNWDLVSRLDVFAGMGMPLLVAASRKRFLSALVAPDPSETAALEDRDSATAALTVLAAQAGAWAVRVHEPRSSRIAADAVHQAQLAYARTAASARVREAGTRLAGSEAGTVPEAEPGPAPRGSAAERGPGAQPGDEAR
ncbi:dihydropteroate synthase [Brevibacterium salitolerans]|uniref:Dihydropteroate synthase n=1 Tax=Brevibacterium salitolerans TaxID=1403566 RepID=A0ABP5IF40_9MICO